MSPDDMGVSDRDVDTITRIGQAALLALVVGGLIGLAAALLGGAS